MKTSSPTSLKPPTPLKILLMGREGTRKTTLCLQFPSVYILDCDRNLDGPELMLRKGLKDTAGKQLVPPIKPDLSYLYESIRYDDAGISLDVEECYNRICDKLKAFKSDPIAKDVKTVVVDSLSHVNEFIIRHTLKMQGKLKKTYEMEARDWSPFKSFAYTLLVGRLEEINRTVICTCHEQKVYGPPSQTNLMQPEIIEYEPFFQGKMGEMLGAFFTDVWRTELRNAPGGKTEMYLQVTKTPKSPNLKNSVGMPPEINITDGFKCIEPYLKGRI